MFTPYNSRAVLPGHMKLMSKAFKIDPRTIFSTNPKTEKSAVQTYILHFSPANTSGVNVCENAKNCAKICLHFAGNPAYLSAKQQARIRRTLAFNSDKQSFMLFLVCGILGLINKNNGEHIAIRLNGTSDIRYEDIDFTITPEFATFCRVKYGAIVPIGKRNIFEVFNYLKENTGELVTFYDYTKLDRNWAECKRLGYHLTFSFDGHDNKQNAKIARNALANGVNVAAAFNIKRSQSLPTEWTWQGKKRQVLDGDLSDFRVDDKQGGHIVGLRFKLPHGMKWTQSERDSFCMA